MRAVRAQENFLVPIYLRVLSSRKGPGRIRHRWSDFRHKCCAACFSWVLRPQSLYRPLIIIAFAPLFIMSGAYVLSNGRLFPSFYGLLVLPWLALVGIVIWIVARKRQNLVSNSAFAPMREALIAMHESQAIDPRISVIPLADVSTGESFWESLR